MAVAVGVGAALGALVFRSMVYGFTWLATGHQEFGQDGHVFSSAGEPAADEHQDDQHDLAGSGDVSVDVR